MAATFRYAAAAPRAVLLLMLLLLAGGGGAAPVAAPAAAAVDWDAPAHQLQLAVLLPPGTSSEAVTATLAALRSAANHGTWAAAGHADLVLVHASSQAALASQLLYQAANLWPHGSLTSRAIQLPADQTDARLQLWLAAPVDSSQTNPVYLIEAGLRPHPLALQFAQDMAAEYADRHHIIGLQPDTLVEGLDIGADDPVAHAHTVYENSSSRHKNLWLPHSQPFLHPLALPGHYVAFPKAWGGFRRWVAAHRSDPKVLAQLQSLVPHLRQRTDWVLTAGQTAALLPVQRRWEAWLMAFCEVAHYLTIFPPISENRHCSLAPLPPLVDADQVAQTSNNECGAFLLAAERRPPRLIHVAFDGTTVAYCRPDSCAAGETCVNNAGGFVCCSTNDLESCSQSRPRPTLAIHLVAHCGEPAGRLVHTLNHIEEAELKLPSESSSSNAASAARNGRAPGVLRRLIDSWSSKDRLMGPAGRSYAGGGGSSNSKMNSNKDGATAPATSTTSTWGVELYITVVLVGPAQQPSDNHCRPLLEVSERWPWPKGPKRVTVVRHPINQRPAPAPVSSLIDLVWPTALTAAESSESLLPAAHQLQADAAAAAVSPAAVLLPAGVELSPLFFQWIAAANRSYGGDSRLSGAALLPSWSSAEQTASSALAGVGAVARVGAGRGALVPKASLRAAFKAWTERKYGSDWSLLWADRDHDAKGDAADSQGQQDAFKAFMRLFERFCSAFVLFTLQPQGRPMARLVEDEHTMALADKWGATSFSAQLAAVDNEGQPLTLCSANTCPQHTSCQDTFEGAVCMCSDSLINCFQDGGRDAAGGQQLAGVGPVPTPLVRLLDDQDTLKAMLGDLSFDNNVIVVTVSAGFFDFFQNWALSAKRLGYTRYLVVAEDYACYQQVEEFAPGQVVLSSLRLLFTSMSKSAANQAASSHGFSYASRQYNDLVSRRPRYLSAVLKLGYNVLYTDTDIVWLEDPFQHFPQGYEMYIASDKEDETFDPWHMLCTGFMFLRSSTAMISFMDNWRRELEAGRGRHVNQYIFNNLFNTAYHDRLPTYVLPDNKFPSGALYFDRRWRESQASPPAMVHNNFIVGPDNKRERFRARKLWFLDQERTTQ